MTSAFVVQGITIKSGAVASEAEYLVGVGWHPEYPLVPHPIAPDLKQKGMET
jgi:gamma-glutamyl-gamma-aminobutyrate hydrolase PuuD